MNGNGGHKRDEVENNAGITGDDAEKRDVLGCFPISFDETDISDFRHVMAVICGRAK